MRVFVTGASGFIGNSVALAFRRAGHGVTGLVRKEADAQKLRSLEIDPLIGDMSDPKRFAQAAQEAEVLVHCASDKTLDKIKHEAQTLDALILGAQKSNLPRTLLYTSGCWSHGNSDAVVDEATPLKPLDLAKWRPAHEEKVLNAATKTLRTVVIRPGFVYGGEGGWTSPWFESAEKGRVEVVGNGENFWSMIHHEDLASAYVLAAEQELNGIVLNITDGTYTKIKDVAFALADAAGIPGKVNFLPYQEALQQLGPVAEGLAVNQKISNQRAIRLLGWRPRHIHFALDIRRYLASWRAYSRPR